MVSGPYFRLPDNTKQEAHVQKKKQGNIHSFIGKAPRRATNTALRPSSRLDDRTSITVPSSRNEVPSARSAKVREDEAIRPAFA